MPRQTYVFRAELVGFGTVEGRAVARCIEKVGAAPPQYAMRG